MVHMLMISNGNEHKCGDKLLDTVHVVSLKHGTKAA